MNVFQKTVAELSVGQTIQSFASRLAKVVESDGAPKSNISSSGSRSFDDDDDEEVNAKKEDADSSSSSSW